MKKIMYIIIMLFVMGITFNSCVEKKEKNEEPMEETQDQGTEVETKADSEDVNTEMQTEDKEVKGQEEGEQAQVKIDEKDSNNG